MNAEVFDKKEYSYSVAMVDFKRICELSVGQIFLMNGIWWIVHSISNGRMYYYNYGSEKKSKKESLGAKSQMFVQVK